MATPKQKAKVGVFLIICITIAATSTVYLSGLYEDQGIPYWIEFDETILGLYEGGLVEYLGVSVGKLTNISVTSKSLMRGAFTIVEGDEEPTTGEPTEPDYRVILTNQDDKKYTVIIDVASEEVFSGSSSEENPTLNLIVGKRYEFTVAKSGTHPLQILAMGKETSEDHVLLAQGPAIGLMEENPVIAWVDNSAQYNGTVSFTVTPQLIEAMRTDGRKPGYRSAVQVFLAHVVLSIDPAKATLHEGVQAQIVLYSLATGTNAIELSGGDPQAPMLPANSQIFSTPSTITAISSQIESVVENLSNISTLLSKSLEGMEEGGLADIVTNANDLLVSGKDFLADGKTLVQETTETITGLHGDARTLIETINTLSEDLRVVSANANEVLTVAKVKLEDFDVDGTVGNLNRVLENIADVSERFNEALKQFDDLSANSLHEADNLEHSFRNVLTEMGTVFDALRIFVDQLKDDPASLLRGRANIEEVNP